MPNEGLAGLLAMILGGQGRGGGSPGFGSGLQDLLMEILGGGGGGGQPPGGPQNVVPDQGLQDPGAPGISGILGGDGTPPWQAQRPGNPAPRGPRRSAFDFTPGGPQGTPQGARGGSPGQQGGPPPSGPPQGNPNPPPGNIGQRSGQGQPPPGGGGQNPFYTFQEFQKPNQAQWWKRGGGDPTRGIGPEGFAGQRGAGRQSYFNWLGNVGHRNMRGDQPSWFQSYEDWNRPGQARWFKDRHGSDKGAYGRWLARKNTGGF